MTTATLPDPEFFLLFSDTAPDDGFNHIVGRIQYALWKLHIRAPISLCGVPLAIDDGEPLIVTPESRPTCHVCAAKAGWQG